MPSQSSLGTDDKTKIKTSLKGCKVLHAALARIYYAYPQPDKWSYAGLQGAIAFVRQENSNIFSFKMVDLEGTRGVVWEHEIYDGLDLLSDRHFFYSFAGDDCMIGFVFTSEPEAKVFSKKVASRKIPKSTKSTQKKSRVSTLKGGRIDKSLISGPKAGSFIHIAHMGYDTDKGFTSSGVDPSWIALLTSLEGAGITQDVIQENQEFIKDFVRDYQQQAHHKRPEKRKPPPPARRTNGSNGNTLEAPTSSPAPPPPVIPPAVTPGTPPPQPVSALAEAPNPPVTSSTLQKTPSTSFSSSPLRVPPPPQPPSRPSTRPAARPPPTPIRPHPWAPTASPVYDPPRTATPAKKPPTAPVVSQSSPKQTPPPSPPQPSVGFSTVSIAPPAPPPPPPPAPSPVTTEMPPAQPERTALLDSIKGKGIHSLKKAGANGTMPLLSARSSQPPVIDSDLDRPGSAASSRSMAPPLLSFGNVAGNDGGAQDLTSALINALEKRNKNMGENDDNEGDDDSWDSE